MKYKALEAIPMELREANELVARLHRHHAPVYRDKFRIGCVSGKEIVGVVQLGRPVSRELYAAMGFPPDYIIDRDYLGNEYKKSAQVARCGNAVCPQVAAALVRANLPEWCGEKITTVEQLEGRIAV